MKWLIALGLVAAAFAQTPAKKYVPPKTPWGDPDLQGTWTSDDTWGVPMERPKQFGDRLYLTEDELKDREKRVQQSKQRIENPSDDNHSPAIAQLNGKSEPSNRSAFLDLLGRMVRAPEESSTRTGATPEPSRLIVP